MVITGLTRNQLASNRTRVRIPPSPPQFVRKPLIIKGFRRFTKGKDAVFEKENSKLASFLNLGREIIGLSPT